MQVTEHRICSLAVVSFMGLSACSAGDENSSPTAAGGGTSPIGTGLGAVAGQGGLGQGGAETSVGASTVVGTGVAGGGTSSGGATSSGGSGSASTGACDATWAPPGTSEWSASYNNTTFSMDTELGVVWDYMTQTYTNPTPGNFLNYAWDQIVANGGYLNYCVRFDQVTNGTSGHVITAAQRTQLQTQLETWINNWIETYMSGYDCWPYGHIPVNIVGWAVSSASELEDYTDTATPVYTTRDGGNVPECDTRCGRYFLYNNVISSYDNCPAGSDYHYDMSLWLTQGYGYAGAGGDWGQRVDADLIYSSGAIMGHEMGHSFGLPDFYDNGAQDFFNLETSDAAQALASETYLMKAGPSQEVTDFDGWMLRMQWNKFLKARFGY